MMLVTLWIRLLYGKIEIDTKNPFFLKTDKLLSWCNDRGVECSPAHSPLLTLGVPSEARLVSHLLDRSDSTPLWENEIDTKNPFFLKTDKLLSWCNREESNL